MFIESFSKLLTADYIPQTSQLFLSLLLKDKHIWKQEDVAEFDGMLSYKARENQEGGRWGPVLGPGVLIRISIWKRAYFVLVNMCIWQVVYL